MAIGRERTGEPEDLFDNRFKRLAASSSRPASYENGIAERLIGTLRRECLDQMLVFGEAHLRRTLSAYAANYNQARTHLALQKMHLCIEPSSDLASSSASRSWLGYITDTSGYDFRKGQV